MVRRYPSINPTRPSPPGPRAQLDSCGPARAGQPISHLRQARQAHRVAALGPARQSPRRFSSTGPYEVDGGCPLPSRPLPTPPSRRREAPHRTARCSTAAVIGQANPAGPRRRLLGSPPKPEEHEPTPTAPYQHPNSASWATHYLQVTCRLRRTSSARPGRPVQLPRITPVERPCGTVVLARSREAPPHGARGSATHIGLLPLRNNPFPPEGPRDHATTLQ